MDFVVIFFLSCVVIYLLILLPSVSSWALLFLLALLLSICIICIKTHFERLSRIEHLLEALVSSKKSEEKDISSCSAGVPPAAESDTEG